MSDGSLEAEVARARRGAGVYAFGPESPVFAGHFPGAPRVPGVFLLEAARREAELELGVRLAIAAVEQAKWLAGVEPGAPIDWEGSVTASSDGGWRVRGDWSRGGEAVARVVLSVREEG